MVLPAVLSIREKSKAKMVRRHTTAALDRELRLLQRNIQAKKRAQEEERRRMHIRIFKQAHVPKGLRQHLMAEFKKSPFLPPGERICRGHVPDPYARGSVRLAQWLVVATVEDGRPVAFATLFDSSFIAADTHRPICHPHEMYLDVVCSFAAHRRVGTQLIQATIDFAKRKGFCALRLSSVRGAMPVWEVRWQFREAEVVRDPATGRCRHGPVVRKATPHAEDDLPTFRMTRLL
jgi:GNAT superfamily N-acetyltransferase